MTVEIECLDQVLETLVDQIPGSRAVVLRAVRPRC